MEGERDTSSDKLDWAKGSTLRCRFRGIVSCEREQTWLHRGEVTTSRMCDERGKSPGLAGELPTPPEFLFRRLFITYYFLPFNLLAFYGICDMLDSVTTSSHNSLSRLLCIAAYEDRLHSLTPDTGIDTNGQRIRIVHARHADYSRTRVRVRRADVFSSTLQAKAVKGTVRLSKSQWRLWVIYLRQLSIDGLQYPNSHYRI